MKQHGGKRLGAGRKRNSGKWGEATKAVRLPESLVDDVMNFVAQKGYKLPLYTSRIAAGFPSPADDDLEKNIDLNQHLVKNPAATFMVRVSGDSMLQAGIHDQDVLIVDRSLPVKEGKVVIAVVNGELTVKRFMKKDGIVVLKAENPDYQDIEIREPENLNIWGVVTNVIHSV